MGHALQDLANHPRSHQCEASFGDFPTLVFPTSPGTRTVKALPHEESAKAGGRKTHVGKKEVFQECRKEEFCVQCEHTLVPWAKFCTECGARVPACVQQRSTKTEVDPAAGWDSASNSTVDESFLGECTKLASS